jgi:hypothetical protein
MSLPAAPAISTAIPSGLPIAPLDAALLSLNSNPYFIGMMMLMLNFGGRFLPMEMTKGQEAIFQNPWVRRALIFIIIFVGTRNVLVAFWMSIAIILCIGYLFNENSSLCLFKAGEPGSKCSTEVSILGGLTQEETEILKRLTDKQQKFVKPELKTKKIEEDKQNASEIYWQNMEALNPRF